MIKNEYEHYTQFCGLCVGSSENQNMFYAQKELLLWHWRLGINHFLNTLHANSQSPMPQQKLLLGIKHVLVFT